MDGVLSEFVLLTWHNHVKDPDASYLLEEELRLGGRQQVQMLTVCANTINHSCLLPDDNSQRWLPPRTLLSQLSKPAFLFSYVLQACLLTQLHTMKQLP